LVKTITPASFSTRPFTSKIECHHCRAKGNISYHCPQHALAIDYEDDSLLEDTDELLVMHPLEIDCDDDLSVMYEDDFLLDEDFLSVMRCILSTSNNSDS